MKYSSKLSSCPLSLHLPYWMIWRFSKIWSNIVIEIISWLRSPRSIWKTPLVSQCCPGWAGDIRPWTGWCKKDQISKCVFRHVWRSYSGEWACSYDKRGSSFCNKQHHKAICLSESGNWLLRQGSKILQSDVDYKLAKKAARALKVINDAAEGSIVLIQT